MAEKEAGDSKLAYARRYLLAAAIILGAPGSEQVILAQSAAIGPVPTPLVSDTQALAQPLEYESASGPLNPSNRSDPRNLDIAGVRLSMVPSEAERALSAAGYEDSGIHPMHNSYSAEVRYERMRRYSLPLGEASSAPEAIIWRKGGQEVRVTFKALPQGPVAIAIAYSAGDVISQHAFLVQAEAKYGKPVNSDDSDMRWCVNKAPSCEDPREAKYPVLAIWPGSRTIHLVGADRGLEEAYAIRFESDVTRKALKAAIPSF